MDKRHRKEYKRVKRITLGAAEVMGMNKVWNIEVLYNVKADERVLAETLADWEYLQAKIDWNLDFSMACSKQKIALTAVHELVHVLHAPMEGLLKDKHSKLGELSTENVARAILACCQHYGGKL